MLRFVMGRENTRLLHASSSSSSSFDDGILSILRIDAASSFSFFLPFCVCFLVFLTRQIILDYPWSREDQWSNALDFR